MVRKNTHESQTQPGKELMRHNLEILERSRAARLTHILNATFFPPPIWFPLDLSLEAVLIDLFWWGCCVGGSVSLTGGRSWAPIFTSAAQITSLNKEKRIQKWSSGGYIVQTRIFFFFKSSSHLKNIYPLALWLSSFLVLVPNLPSS